MRLTLHTPTSVCRRAQLMPPPRLAVGCRLSLIAADDDGHHSEYVALPVWQVAAGGSAGRSGGDEQFDSGIILQMSHTACELLQPCSARICGD